MTGRILRASAAIAAAVLLMTTVFMPSASGQPLCFEDVLTEVEVIEQVGEYEVRSRVTGTVEVVVDCPEEEDEVLEVVATPDDVLAHTGNEATVAAAIGFTLIGTGGLALYASRRRREQQQD